jgi:tRNA (cmo5U34)-methyltransferase
MNEFDIKASGWDNNPMHWDRSRAIAEEMQRVLPLNGKMKTLEFGAGTGILSFMLKDQLEEITLMDSSTEMIRIIKEKIKATGVKNFKPLFYDLEHVELPDSKFDLIFTQMVLHHVADVELIFERFYKMLNSGGHLAIADLYSEDGSFHGKEFTGHLGFDVEVLARILSKNHFTNISHRKCFTINRKVEGQKTQQFPVFLLTANRI